VRRNNTQHVPSWFCDACDSTTNCRECPGNVCKKCMPGFFEVPAANGAVTCAACSTMGCGSEACDALKGCHKCPAGHSLVSANNGRYKNRLTCKDCSTVTADCVACNNNACAACGNNKALSKDGRTCAKIDNGSGAVNMDITNCQAAQIFDKPNDAGKHIYKCNTCNPSFFEDTAGNCAACPQGCAFCRNANSCDMCKPGSYYDRT
jgi:hypothetical protein